MARKWYRLDNAAKIFPSVSNRGRSNIFRLSFDMVEIVDPLLLQKALEITIKRFPVFNVRLKKGFFWYYFETNESTPKLEEENPIVCKSIEDFRANNGFLFHLYYYHKRITLEIFHSLTDGSGALEFLKSIVYTYLKLQDIKIEASPSILSGDVEITKEELQDSFNMHYNPTVKNTKKDTPALKFKSPIYENHWLGLIVASLKVDQIKKVAKKYGCTITELLIAIVMHSAYQSRHLFENKDKPFSMLIPVNLRRFFSSKTVRNFSLFVTASIKLDQEMQFVDIVEHVKTTMKEEVQKERLQQRFAFNVRTERNLAMRLVPRVIKEFVLRVGYRYIGDSVNSFTLSNIGAFDLPEAMEKFIDKVYFANGASISIPLNVGVISFKNKLTITFTTALIDRSIPKTFFRFLSKEGVEIVIENNDLEV